MPAPQAAARTHSRSVAAHIQGAIDAAGGSISFRDYMEQVLYTPGLGYYAAAGGANLSEQGDFVTAPQVSGLYAACLARQTAEVLGELGGGTVLELGPGSGILAADLLTALDKHRALPDRYLLLERSAALREIQQTTLAARVPELLDRVAWLDRWPDGLVGVVLANEVLDALPVEVFRVASTGLEQRRVRWLDGGPADLWAPASADLAAAVARIEADIDFRLAEGYVSELCPDLSPWFAGLESALARGAALFVDYGYVRREYYLPERSMGTLVCTRAHRAHDDPYDWPGLTDITAFVDFTAVTEAATEAGFELEGFTPQAHFLIANGLEDVAGDGLSATSDLARFTTAGEVKKLTLPGEMGERFNVIGFSRGLEQPLRGFSLNDLSRRL